MVHCRMIDGHFVAFIVDSCFGVKKSCMASDIKDNRKFSVENLSEMDFGILHWTWIVSIQTLHPL